jgi:Flp pilus assembly protein TadG
MKIQLEKLIPATELELAFALILLVLAAAVFQSYQIGVFGHVASGVREAVRNSVKLAVRRIAEELRDISGARDTKVAAHYSSTKH